MNERVPGDVEDRWFRPLAGGSAGGSWEYTAADRPPRVSAECRLKGVGRDWVWSREMDSGLVCPLRRLTLSTGEIAQSSVQDSLRATPASENQKWVSVVVHCGCRYWSRDSG